MDFRIARHLAAISPYFKILHQPAVPASHHIDSAIYLFRHGIIHVSGHDYDTAIAPFLHKLLMMQQSGRVVGTGRLAFLTNYSSWITQGDVGKLSLAGLQQSRNLGEAIRTRYSAWLAEQPSASTHRLRIWTDSAERCEASAQAFGEGFSGNGGEGSPHDSLQSIAVEPIVIDASVSEDPSDNLCWHHRYQEIDQSAGQDQADTFLQVYTDPIVERLKFFNPDESILTSKDIYAMQLLCCYDLVAGKESLFSDLFNEEDWLGFEYMRDLKYHYSEGYGALHAGEYAAPWLDAAMEMLLKARKTPGPPDGRLPLWVAFTHREKVLHLAVLLGLAWDGPDAPSTSEINKKRRWRVTELAPYLGHVGLERFRSLDGRDRIRVIVNGEVVPAFKAQLTQDDDGGYDVREVQEWVSSCIERWDTYRGGRIRFLDCG